MPEEKQENIQQKGERPLSPRQIEQRRAASKRSSGPRTAEGKKRAALRGLKHGLYSTKLPSHTAALYHGMAEIGENPEEFNALHQSLIDSFNPSTASESILVREIARLHWERQRLERAQEALIARRVQELEIARQRKSLEVSQRISSQTPALHLSFGYFWLDESPEKYQKLLELLDQLRQCVNLGVYAGAKNIIDLIYGPTPSVRGVNIKTYFEDLAEAAARQHPESAEDSAAPDEAEAQPEDAAEEVEEEDADDHNADDENEDDDRDDDDDDNEGDNDGDDEDDDSDEDDEDDDEDGETSSGRIWASPSALRRELEAEIASISQQYALYKRQYDVTPTMRAECLVPTVDQRWLMRQLGIIDRGIDRKVRLLMHLKKADQEGIQPEDEEKN